MTTVDHLKRCISIGDIGEWRYGTKAVVLATNLGASVSIGQPGFYGQIDIGYYPQPQLICRQPVYIERHERNRPPVYLRVPPGHAKNWSKHRREYNACGERVYFVQDSWYQHEYVPRYQERHGNRQDERRDESRGDNRNDHPGNGREHGNKH